jgi:hypothetical protein
MPLLGLRNRASKAYNRVTTIVVDEDFSSDTGGFTASVSPGATLSVSGGKLVVTDGGSGGGYGVLEMACHGSTTYSYSIDYTDANPGNGTMKIGTSANDSSLKSVTLGATGTFTGTFTTATKAIYISLVVANANRVLKFDNLLVQENN